MALKDLREKRAKLIADARAIVDKADAEKRGLSPEEVTSQRAMLTDAKALVEQIRNEEELEQEERDIRASLPESQRTAKTETADIPESRKAYNGAVERYMRVGFASLEADDRKILRGHYVTFDGENRAQSTLSGAAGGFAIAPDTSFYGKVLEAQKYFGPLLNPGVCTIINTSTGADLPIATDDDTSNKGVRVAEEGSHASGTNVTMGQKILKAYLYSTKIVKVSWQLAADSSFDFNGYLARKFGTRLGRIKNEEFTTGTGNGQPLGVQFGASVGRQGATGNSTTVTFDELKRAKHAVDIAYRSNGRWMFNDNTALAISLLKDGNGRYLLTDSVREGDVLMLLGHPVLINNDMPDMGASVKSILFGDITAQHIRQVQGMQVVRLDELYAENGQIGFMAFERADAGLIDAGQGPVKAWQNSAA